MFDITMTTTIMLKLSFKWPVLCGYSALAVTKRVNTVARHPKTENICTLHILILVLLNATTTEEFLLSQFRERVLQNVDWKIQKRSRRKLAKRTSCIEKRTRHSRANYLFPVTYLRRTLNGK